jgi:hypothetical protein
MNPNIVEKNGKITYTNYRGVRLVGIILLGGGSVCAYITILQFLGAIEFSDPSWAWTAKGNVPILIWFLFFACVPILTAMYYFWRGKTFYVTLGPGNLQYKLSDKVHNIKYRDIDEVLWTQHDGGVRIRRKGKLVLEILPDWFFGSKAEEFVELLKTRIGAPGEIEYEA